MVLPTVTKMAWTGISGKKTPRADLIALDDWGLDRLTREQALDLLELLEEDCHGLKSTLVAAQVPGNHWREIIGDPTLPDALPDRLIHGAHKTDLKIEPMRKILLLDQKGAKLDYAPRLR